ncbi:MAG: dockerin type I domain-containing protein, partial [Dehalococcoidia bacterium]
TPSALLPGDITGDDIVDIDDLTILKSAYGAGSEDPAYRLEADLNGDQVVNYLDLAILGAGYTGP